MFTFIALVKILCQSKVDIEIIFSCYDTSNLSEHRIELAGFGILVSGDALGK